MGRNQIHKRAISLLLSLALVLSIFGVDTVSAYAAQNYTPTVLYLDSGDIVITNAGATQNGQPITRGAQDSGYLITQNGNGEVQHSITVHSGTQDITLQNVRAKPAHNSAFEVESGAEADITLVGSNSLDTSGSSSYRAGLAVNVGSTVHISGRGSLTATGGDSSAGIGGNDYQSCGIVEISGGTVTANGNAGSAGIGGGANGTGGDITISGGTVIANGNGGTGIGGGAGGAGGSITINGGKVTAIGDGAGAGIGGGQNGAGGSVTVSGGTITANGGIYGAGIGGGGGGSGGTVMITGGNVSATDSDYGAGIGGGSLGAGAIVTISGPNTQVTAKGKSGGKDIGSGDGGTDGGSLTVGDSNTAEPLPVLELLSEGTNAANPNTSRPQFMNCVIQGAGAKDASGNDISGCYDANGKVRLSVTMPTPVSGKVGEPVMLSVNVKRHYFNDTVTLPGAVQFTTGSGKMLGSSPVTNGMAQTNWTPTNNNTVWLIATYVPAANDRYGSAESTPFDYTPGKTTPTVSVLPTASTVMTGSPLSVSRFSGGNVTGIGGATVPGSFEWANPNTTVTASGNYEAIFTPADTAVYNPVSGIKVPVTVTAAPAPAPSGSGGSSHSAPSLPSSLTDVPTNTTVNLSGAVMPAGVASVSLTVTPEMANGTSSVPGNVGIPSDPQGAKVYHLVISQTGLNLIGSPFVYNIKLLDQNGNPITSFTGSVTVKIPVPAGIHGTPHIFRYEESTGTFTDLGATVQDGYLVFTTTHFSYYVIAGTGNSVTLDTKSYQMPVGGKYQIGVKLTGSKAATVKTYSTNEKIAAVTRLKNGNVQVTGRSTGTVWIMFDVYDSKNKLLTHVSTRVDVKTGIRPRGDSTRQISVF